MIKTQNKQMSAPLVATVAPPTLETAKSFFAGSINRTIQEKTNITQQITNTRSSLRSRIADIYSYKQRLADIERTIAEYDWSTATTRAQAEIDRIAKFPFIEKIEGRENEIIITTRLLFTPVRLDGDTRETQRRCIGAFTIKLGESSVNIKNNLFINLYHPHWSINSAGQPCWGDWGEEVRRYYDNHEIASLTLMLFHYLTSTEDGSAYQRSHNWVKDRKMSLLRNRIRKGAYVMATETYFTNEEYVDDDPDNGVNEEWCIPSGTKGTVIESDRNVTLVKWNQPVSYPWGESGDEDDGTLWHTPKTILVPLRKKEYENTDVNNVDHVNTMSLDAIDELPDGSTLSDAKRTLGLK